jgi:hypothetical protein
MGPNGGNFLGETHWRIGIIVAMILLKTKFESPEKKVFQVFEWCSCGRHSHNIICEKAQKPIWIPRDSGNRSRLANQY